MAWIHTIIALVVIVGGAYGGLMFYQNVIPHDEIPEVNANQVADTQENVSSNDSIVKDAFDKIALKKYDVDNYNCVNKSQDFAIFLKGHGAKTVYLVTVEHNSGEYGHMMVLWNDKIYDATCKPAVYGMDKDLYFKMIAEDGFTGLRTTAPFRG